MESIKLKNKKGYKKTKLGLIPEDWELNQLENLCSKKGEYGINAAAVDYDPNLPTYLRITDIDDEGNFINEGKKSVKDTNAKNFILKEDDIVFARTGATVGKTYLHNYINGELIFAGFLIRFRVNKNKLLPYYLKLFTNSSSYWNWVKVYSMRSGQPGINSKEISSMMIPLPSLSEQNNIIGCLSTWDKATQTLSNLIEQKKLQKKGLMQQLLTGKKRLQSYKKIKIIEKLKPFIKEYSERNNEGKVNRVLSVTNKKGFINQSEQFERVVASKDLSNYKIVRKGQFAYNPSRVNVGSLDLLKNFEEGLLSPMYVIFETKKDKLLPDFLYYQLKTWWFKGHIPQFVQGSVRDSLSFKGLSNMTFFMPAVEEQLAITNILKCADKEIELLKAKLKQLKVQKKGLMQQLLTGKKRLKF